MGVGPIQSSGSEEQMNTVAIGASAAGFASVMAAWIRYMATIPSGKVPARPVVEITMQTAGIGLAGFAIAWSLKDGGSPGVAVIILAAFALMMGSFFLWLLTQRKTPIGDIKVKVGDRLLAFEATTSAGKPFSTESLANKRTLLKFFRGGW